MTPDAKLVFRPVIVTAIDWPAKPAAGLTLLIEGGAVTVIGAEPETLVNPVWAELAVQLALPTPEGVKTPAVVIVPPVAVQVTAELYAPIPLTVALHCEVCPVVMLEGLAVTDTPVTVMAAVTVIGAEPKTLVNPVWAEFAVQLALPAPDGVKSPAVVIVPPVAVQVTAELYVPVPFTVALHCEVCAVVIEDGVAVTETEVTVGDVDLLLPLLPPQPASHRDPTHASAINT